MSGRVGYIYTCIHVNMSRVISAPTHARALAYTPMFQLFVILKTYS